MVWPAMIAGGAGGPVFLILLPDLVYLIVVGVDMMDCLEEVDLVGLVYGVRDDMELPAAENSEFVGICSMGVNLLEVLRGEALTKY